MRINNPWNFLGVMGQMNRNLNFLDIDAKAMYLKDGGGVAAEALFQFDQAQQRFIGLNKANVINHFKWKDVSRIELTITLAYDITIALETFGEGKATLLQPWKVIYGETGTTLQPEPWKNLGQPYNDGNFSMNWAIDNAVPSVESTVGWARTILHLTGSYSKGKYLMDFEFLLIYLAANRPPIQLPEYLLSHDVFFEDEDDPEIRTRQLERLAEEWVKPLRKEAPRLAEAIAAGKCPLRLIGHASVTGRNKEYNMELSAKRIASVGEALKKALKSDKLIYHPVPLGQTAATQPGPSDQERRVEIVIIPEVAKSALSVAP